MPSYSLFKRRKDTSTPPPPSSATGAGSGISNVASKQQGKQKQDLSASLPASYKQYGKLRDDKLPALPPLAERQNGTARHATAPSPQMFVRDSGSNPNLQEFGKLETTDARTSIRNAPPAFVVHQNSSQSHFIPVQTTRQDSSTSAQKLLRRASTGSVPSLDHLLDKSSAEELQLCYGYWPIETQRELSLSQIEEIVRLCGHEIRTRGIEEPLLFSTQALDISCDNICSLIRAYLTTRDIWRKDLRFANPHDLCGMIKWALGRYVNPQGARGFLTWETYERWRFGERAKEFPPRYITTHMLYLLPTQLAALLSSLFNLMSSALAYTTKNGCTSRKLATLFGAFLFGLPDDGTFEQTYTAFNRFSHATEHLLLAYIRDQTTSHTSAAPAPVPVRIQEVIKDYPWCLPTNLNKPPSSASMQQVVRIRRLVRFYSKNLVATAGTWEVPRSASWAVISPFPSLKPPAQDDEAAPFVYSTQYKHLLNIRGSTIEENEEEMQRFGSVVEKEWSSFMQAGFAAPDESKLKFDLTESERKNRLQRRKSVDWDTFEGTGFVNLLAMDLAFDPLVDTTQEHGGLLSPQHRSELVDKARQIEKSLPPFNHDTTARDERTIQVDKQFFEIFSDVLCSSGWIRDEMKESNWALLQFKARPQGAEKPTSPSFEGRSEDRWFLVEELIPSDYRAALLIAGQQKPKSSRRISFLRTVRKKTSKLPPVPNTPSALGIHSGRPSTSSKTSLPYPQSPSSRSASPGLRIPDASLFAPGKGGYTEKLSLSNSFSANSVSHDSIAEEAEVLHDESSAYPDARNRDGLQSGPAPTLSGLSASQVPASFPRKSDEGKGGAAGILKGLARRATRRHRHSTSSIDISFRRSESDSSIPGVANSGLQHQESAASRPGIGYALSPRANQNGVAAASIAETTQSILTRGTHGHGNGDGTSEASSQRRSEPAEPLVDAANPVGASEEPSPKYDRDLPPAPNAEASANDHNGDLRRASVMTDNPYDGMADESTTVEEDGGSPYREAPVSETVYDGSVHQSGLRLHEAVEADEPEHMQPISSPAQPEIRMYPVDHNGELQAEQTLLSARLDVPNTQLSPSTPPKSLIPVARDPRHALTAAQVEARKAALMQSSAPQQGSGKVAALAGRFNK